MSVASDKEIVEAIVIVVAHGNTSGVAGARDAGFFGHVFKGAVGFLVVKAIPIFLAVFLRNRAFGRWIVDARAIGEEDVEATVVVVVEESNPRTHGLQQILFGGWGSLLLEMDAELLSHVDEAAWSGCKGLARTLAGQVLTGQILGEQILGEQALT